MVRVLCSFSSSKTCSDTASVRGVDGHSGSDKDEVRVDRDDDTDPPVSSAAFTAWLCVGSSGIGLLGWEVRLSGIDVQVFENKKSILGGKDVQEGQTELDSIQLLTVSESASNPAEKQLMSRPIEKSGRVQVSRHVEAFLP